MMIVEVDPTSKFGYTDCTSISKRYSCGYKDLQCIQGCLISLTISGIKFTMPTLNKHGIRAVYCDDCMTTRHLSKFQEYKF